MRECCRRVRRPTAAVPCAARCWPPGAQLLDGEEAQLLVGEVLLHLFQDPPAELLVAELLEQSSERGLDQPALGVDARRQAVPVLELEVLVADLIPRSRPWTPEESQDFLAVQQKLRTGLPADFGAQLDRIDQLVRPLLAAPQPGTPPVSSAAARSRSTTAPKRPAQPGQSPAPTGPQRATARPRGAQTAPRAQQVADAAATSRTGDIHEDHH